MNNYPNDNSKTELCFQGENTTHSYWRKTLVVTLFWDVIISALKYMSNYAIFAVKELTGSDSTFSIVEKNSIDKFKIA